MQVSRLNHISAASGVAYAETRGAATLSNWTDVGPKALPKLFEATPSCAPCGFSSSECSGSTRTRNPSVNSRGIQNLNALIGVAYRERQRFSVPQWGYLGYQVTPAVASSVRFLRRSRVSIHLRRTVKSIRFACPARISFQPGSSPFIIRAGSMRSVLNSCAEMEPSCSSRKPTHHHCLHPWLWTNSDAP